MFQVWIGDGMRTRVVFFDMCIRTEEDSVSDTHGCDQATGVFNNVMCSSYVEGFIEVTGHLEVQLGVTSR